MLQEKVFKEVMFYTDLQPMVIYYEYFQYIEATHLETSMLKENPCKYHEAWHQLVSAK